MKYKATFIAKLKVALGNLPSREFKALALAILIFAIPSAFNACADFKAADLLRSMGASLDHSEAAAKLDGSSLYAAKCSVCHGDMATTPKRFTTFEAVRGAFDGGSGTMADFKHDITNDEIAAIVGALNGAAAPAPENRSVFYCAADRGSGASILRRLTKYELTNTLNDLLGASVATGLQNDLKLITESNVLHGYDNLDQSVSSQHINSFEAFAEKAGSYITSSGPAVASLIGACAHEEPVKDVCVTNFISSFGTKALRRPITEQEKANLLAMYKVTSLPIDSMEGFRMLFYYFLQASEFHYRVETGVNPASALVGTPLTNYELATRLSYLLWGTMPDSTLLTKAQQGTLADTTVYAAEVDRMLADAKAKKHMQHFYSQWLAPWSSPNESYGATFLNGISQTNVLKDLAREQELFIEDVVFRQRGGYRELMTSDVVFPVSASVASIYQTAQWTPGQPGLRAPAGTRAGLLTHGRTLASATDATRPVKRGVFFRTQVLCGVMPSAASAGIPAEALIPPAPSGTISTRESFHRNTAPGACMKCHGVINPAGFALSDYDSLGRYQTSERIFDSSGNLLGSASVDARVELQIDAPKKVYVNGGVELGAELAQSVEGPACFTKQWYRYAMGRFHDDYDGCTLNSAYNELMKPNGSVIGMIRATVMSPTFKNYRARE